MPIRTVALSTLREASIKSYMKINGWDRETAEEYCLECGLDSEAVVGLKIPVITQHLGTPDPSDMATNFTLLLLRSTLGGVVEFEGRKYFYAYRSEAMLEAIQVEYVDPHV